MFTLLLTRVLNFNEVQFINFFVMAVLFCVLFKKAVPHLNLTQIFLLSSRSSTYLPSIFSSLTHLELFL